MNTRSVGLLRNALAILRSIDRDDLDQAGFVPTDAQWIAFRDDPYSFYLRATADRQAAIFNIIKARMHSR
ncbi:hypothetical protein [Sinorhizobium chiapasense]|uniref:Uncharacterized protein n=1 Tax=Sinorhizobium chiapasense TaxID=501572 RepID=A0ABZ2BAV9_9HYPH